MDQEKEKQVDSMLAKLDKQYGKGTAFFGKDSGKNQVDIERWKISSPSISYVLGGGVPKGRIIELYGPEGGGKTSMATYLAGEVQKQGGLVAIEDMEYSFDLDYAKSMGLNSDEIIFSQPESGENALSIAETFANDGVDLVIIDSVSALTPQAEIDGDMGASHMGLQARLMSQACRKLASVLGRKKCNIIFINQIRMKIGVVFGNPETTSGGMALKFYSSIRLEVRKGDWLRKGEGGEPYGMVTRVKATKNKTAPPFRKADIEIVFGDGFQLDKEYFDFAVEYKLIDKSGSWYSIGNDRLGQGKANAVQALQDNPEEWKFDEMKKMVNKILSGDVDSSEEPKDRKREKAETVSKPDPPPINYVTEGEDPRKKKRGRPKKES